MFWSGNYIAVRELNFLLKEENVSLSQVLEADDILQECKADNKALMQFLTKPEVLAELITLITEEPPKNVELASQYRHASIACEVLTSHLSMLSDRLSLDTVQMNRLCDFINQEPPLNPLLASYFSKTVEMLLERSPKQDWYLFHIVCLRVLDFFKSRRDFLPNLLRHLATSAIADTFKYFIRLDDLFNKIIMEWLDEHQFLESLIQIICGTYVPEPLRAEGEAGGAGVEPEPASANHNEDGEGHTNTDTVNNTEDTTKAQTNVQKEKEEEDPELKARVAARMRAVAAANAAGLLCDLILHGCAPDVCSSTSPRTVRVLVSRLQAEGWVRALLGGVFTAPPAARPAALVHGCLVLLALLSADPIRVSFEEGGTQCCSERTSVELAVAPHLPLLHQALLEAPAPPAGQQEQQGDAGRRRVGAARVHVAALLAQLARSEVQDVPSTLLTLGTPGTLLDMFFLHEHNNFLHAQLYTLLDNALANRAYRTMYANHLLIECDLLTRLMDVFEENESKKPGVPRAGYMGHVVLMLRLIWRALEEHEQQLASQLRLPPAAAARWAAFTEDRLQPLQQQHDTPLGGYYPPENTYEVENMVEPLEGSYDYSDGVGGTLDDIGEDINIDAAGEVEGELGSLDDEKFTNAKHSFLELVNQRANEDMWEDAPGPDDDAGVSGARAHDVEDVLAAVSPWECNSGAEAQAAGEGWAQWGEADPFAAPTAAPAVPAAPAFTDADFTAAFWPPAPGDNTQTQESSLEDTKTADLETSLRNLTLSADSGPNTEMPLPGSRELANNLLTAMSGMTPDLIANIVNANLIEESTLPPAESTSDPPSNESTNSESNTDTVESPSES